MKTGCTQVMGTWFLVVLAASVLGTGPVSAQTPDTACAADSLYLISPNSLNLVLQTEEPLGLVVSWPNLDLDQATCFSLADTAGLDYQVDVSGGFGDKVDRVFQFATSDSGTIGANQPNPLIMTWKHQGPSINGAFEGKINLADNGGIWHYSVLDGTWDQINQGLPMTWKQVNVVALGEGPDGTLIAGMTQGEAISSDPMGLYINHGQGWSRIAESTFDNLTLITQVAVSPTDSDHFLVGTERRGLFVTRDGGQSFTQVTTQLDSGGLPLPPQFRVSALAWLGDNIFLAITNLGVYSSQNEGTSFVRLNFTVPSDLDSREPEPILPTVNDFEFDSADPNHILASLQFHGVYESDDGGETWHDLYGDLLVPDPEISGVWVNSALASLADPGDEQVIVMAISQKGLYRTSDGGQTWSEVGENVQPENRAVLTRTSLLAVPSQPGVIYALEDGYHLLVSEDFGETWNIFDPAPVLDNGVQLLNSVTGEGDFLYGTYGGGDYKPGTSLDLAKTYTTGTSPSLRSLDLGLQISFSADEIHPFEPFRLICQTFQGWAVWRAPAFDRRHPDLLGLYDRVNPESCLEGYCGDPDIQIKPNCFAEKRAACFDLSNPDTIRFFDAEIYNGFDYYYSVTSFDYGNTALTTPANNSSELLFSPRWSGGDDSSPFSGDGNQSYVQINLAAEPAFGGKQIYVYPNPLRPHEGIPGEEGRTVVFKNLPQGSSIRVFTVAGDDVMTLDNGTQRGGQIYWNTENRDGHSVGPGVYLYKVEMPQSDPFWGRLVVIR